MAGMPRAGGWHASALVVRFPTALEVLRWGGAAYLAWWAARSAFAAMSHPVG